MKYRAKSKIRVKTGTGFYTPTKAILPEGSVLKSSHQTDGFAYIDKYKGWVPIILLEPIEA